MFVLQEYPLTPAQAFYTCIVLYYLIPLLTILYYELIKCVLGDYVNYSPKNKTSLDSEAENNTLVQRSDKRHVPVDKYYVLLFNIP